ncbi:hypothetical protein ACN95_14630 [Gordonia sihwensis]|uniref:DUF7426 family protein n=1 Tax=Gordonia sihwensis TaxID=173559 RepID=UPI001C92E853|nr:hypothetical protein [Gordonia sihwensis]MBY4571253.1 hypothetical protein [Gordonia sihwensis]WFN91477.1 hypothetical protein P5P27_11860 [Gordonia sihwensis]WFN91535.1 hypothetical protein P5P27_12150 [Gordonia sihwensis]
MSHNAFADLADFHDPDLYLTIRGKEYRIPQPNASVGLKIRQAFMSKVISDATELEFIADILGAHWEPDVQTVTVLDPMTGEPVLDADGNPVVEEQDHGTWVGGVWSQMDADGVGWEELMHAGRTALIDVGMGRLTAETHWRTGLVASLDGAGSEGNPLPAKPEPNRAARRAKAPAKKAAKRTQKKTT